MWDELQHPQAEQGLLSVPPNAPPGMGQGPGRLFVGFLLAVLLQTNKQNDGVCLRYLGNNVSPAPLGMTNPR